MITKADIAAAKTRPMTMVSINPDGFMGNAHITEGWLVEAGRRPWAQYQNAPYVVFVPKGKRLARQWQGSYKPFCVVFEGHGLNIKVQGLFGAPESDGPVTVMRGRHSSCSPEWRQEAEEACNRPDLKILFDGRGDSGEKKYG